MKLKHLPLPTMPKRKIGVCIGDADCGRWTWCCTIALSVLSSWRTWVLAAAGWRKDFSLVAVWGRCNLWAVFQRWWALCKHLYRTASSILFVSQVSPALSITSTVHIWLSCKQWCRKGVHRRSLNLNDPWLSGRTYLASHFQEKKRCRSQSYVSEGPWIL